MRIIAFITKAVAIREILGHLGEPIAPPRLLPAHGPPLWERYNAGPGEIEPQAHNPRQTTSSINASRGRADQNKGIMTSQRRSSGFARAESLKRALYGHSWDARL